MNRALVLKKNIHTLSNPYDSIYNLKKIQHFFYNFKKIEKGRKKGHNNIHAYLVLKKNIHALSNPHVSLCIEL
jgi:hypothetical protein